MEAGWGRIACAPRPDRQPGPIGIDELDRIGGTGRVGATGPPSDPVRPRRGTAFPRGTPAFPMEPPVIGSDGHDAQQWDDEMLGVSAEALDDEAIRERTRTLRQRGFPPAELVRLVEEIASTASGTVAEEALARLVEQLETDALNTLVKTHVMDPQGPGTPDWTIRPGNEMAIRLSQLGFEVRAGGTGKWTVTLENGEQMVRTYDSGEDRGEALCRLGLLARWVSDMRERDDGDGSDPDPDSSSGADRSSSAA